MRSFVAGSDAVEWAMNAIKAQIDAWRDLSVSTDGDWDVKAQGTKEGKTALTS